MPRLRNTIIVIAWIGGLTCLSPTSLLLAREYTVTADPRTDTVRFRSTAKLEFIEGSNHDINGWIDFEPNKTRIVAGRLQVDLRTLKTGIDLRDRHMRENHLNTDEFPYAYFKLDSVSGLPSDLQTDTQYTCDASGLFFIHGHKRELTAGLTIEIDQSENLIIVSTRFEIDLDDYEIDRPRALFLKLAKTIEISVTFTAVSGSSHFQPVLPDWK